MKSKFKDYLLYTLSTIGVVALFISATTQPPQTSIVPESHVWELIEASDRGMAINKVTGEVKLYVRDASGSGTTTGLKEYKAIPTPYGKKDPY